MISKSSSDNAVDQGTFSFSVDGKTRLSDSTAWTAKSRASNKIIESVLNISTHKKQALALQCALFHHRLFKQASTCGYVWKYNKRLHAVLEILNNKNEMIKLAKVKVNCVNRGRINDNKNNFGTANIVSIVAGTPIHSIGNHMKNIDIPWTTRYGLFRRGNVKIK